MTAPGSPDLAAMVSERGYVLVYRREQVNHCPGCGYAQWLVGRSTAECAHCGTALPLMHPAATAHPQHPQAKD